MPVVLAGLFAVATGRNLNLHALAARFLNDGVTVIALVGNQVLSVNAFNQRPRLCAIRSGTFCSNNSERHTMRIHGQVYLGVEPPFVRLMP